MFLKFYCSEEQNECKLLPWSNNNEIAASIALKCFKELEIKRGEKSKTRKRTERLCLCGPRDGGLCSLPALLFISDCGGC